MGMIGKHCRACVAGAVQIQQKMRSARGMPRRGIAMVMTVYFAYDESAAVKEENLSRILKTFGGEPETAACAWSDPMPDAVTWNAKSQTIGSAPARRSYARPVLKFRKAKQFED
jgi:hypothetical protein